MDFNLVVVAGSLAVSPESTVISPGGGLRLPPGADQSTRLLLTVRTGAPESRVDLLPIVVRRDQIPAGVIAGDRVWVSGQLQRRFNPSSGRSRVVITAHSVQRQLSACDQS